MSERKFKVGDRVRFLVDNEDGPELRTQGDEGSVTQVEFDMVELRPDNDRSGNDVVWALIEELELINPVSEPSKTKSDGGSSTYYDLPEGARDIDDLIVHKQMPWPIANIFKACYRFGEKAGTEKGYDVNKILFFAGRMKERLEKAQ